MVMEVPAIDAVLFIEAVIQPHIIFAPVEWIWLLEGGVISSGCVCVGRRKLFHRAVNRSDRGAILGDSGGLAVESEVRKIATWNWLSGRNGGAGCRVDRGVPCGHIQRAATQAEIAGPFRAGRHRLSGRIRKLTDVFVFLSDEKEEL